MLRISGGVRSIPLVNSWYAHYFLISPLTFGLYCKNSHIPLLESFIEAPEEHRASILIPELRGGPFIDYDGPVDDISEFLKQTLKRCSAQIDFANAIEDAYKIVSAVAQGAGVAPVYPQIPESIRYYLEVSYDVNKSPILRFIEPLLYAAPISHQSLQTCRLEPVSTSERPFTLSTPQLSRPASSVDLMLPFAHPLWDRLYGGFEEETSIQSLCAPFINDQDLRDGSALQVLAGFVDEVPAEREASQEVRVRYFGHACVLIEGAGKSILIDPLVSYEGESEIEHFTFADLPEQIDYLLITHPHQDHIIIETLMRLRHKTRAVVVGRGGGGSMPDISLKLLFTDLGFHNVIELSEYSTIDFPGGSIVGAPFYGEHADFDIRSKLVYGVKIRDRTMLFFADSNPPAAEFYEPLRRMFPNPDCLFLGMECIGAPATWLYGPFLQKTLTRREDQTRRLDGCNAKTAMELWNYFNPARLYIYAMGAEPWLTHITSILYSEALPQFIEARTVESAIREAGGFSELLYGRMELCCER